MSATPKISIITPSFNLGNHIKKAIDSVLSQDYANFEYIVIDGGSRDNTIDILKSYDTKLKWISEPDNGQTDAINKGLKMCGGDLFAWLNADDYYEPDAFQKVAAIYIKNPNVGVIYGNCYMDYITEKQLSKPLESIDLKKMLNEGNLIYGPASFYNLPMLKQLGGFDTSIDYWMDYDVYLKLKKISDFYYIDENLANFTVRPGQKSRSDNKAEYKKFLMEAYQVSLKNGGSRYSPLSLAHYPKIVKIIYTKIWDLLYS